MIACHSRARRSDNSSGRNPAGHMGTTGIGFYQRRPLGFGLEFVSACVVRLDYRTLASRYLSAPVRLAQALANPVNGSADIMGTWGM
jgi:hypothetical protein